MSSNGLGELYCWSEKPRAGHAGAGRLVEMEAEWAAHLKAALG